MQNNEILEYLKEQARLAEEISTPEGLLKNKNKLFYDGNNEGPIKEIRYRIINQLRNENKTYSLDELIKMKKDLGVKNNLYSTYLSFTHSFMDKKNNELLNELSNNILNDLKLKNYKIGTQHPFNGDRQNGETRAWLAIVPENRNHKDAWQFFVEIRSDQIECGWSTGSDIRIDGEYIQNRQKVSNYEELIARLLSIKEEIVIKNKELDIEQFKKLHWWEIIALSMYIEDENAKYSEQELNQHKVIKYAIELKQPSSTTFSTEMREHSNADVKYKRKDEYFTLYKEDYKRYSLNLEGKKYVKDNLKKFFNLCEEIDSTKIKSNKGSKNMDNQPLNQILYGPPGTGKTYSIKDKVLLILNNKQHFEEWYYKTSNAKDVKKAFFDYMSAISKIKENMKIDIFEIKDKEIFVKKKEEIKTSDYFKENYEHAKTTSGSSYYESALNLYEKFLSDKDFYIDINSSKYTKFITFHQSYSYEEFVEGIKPEIDWYAEAERKGKTKPQTKKSNDIRYIGKKGIFREICQRAEQHPNDNYVLIIDEINRGNISKIFGELITLIEEDKRENVTGDTSKEYNTIKVTLPYSGNTFSVPNNLYIIGTMNTSDRSIASVDIALRRRFKFEEMMPKESCVDDEKVKFANGKTIRDIFNLLNKRICALLDRDHQIGHSYFIGVDTIDKLKDVWFDNVMPLLNEYFYGDWEKLQAILGKAEESDNGYSFIQRFNTSNLFADNNICDELYYCDFRDKSKYDDKNFKEALLDAFYNIKPEKEQDKQNKDEQQ